ncbi:MAG: hypothetical protein KAU89_06760 [Candidatus Thorarchaeota archaeon]|nr:hypothetical protein [Candidatus Thorarchaeota archaeon]
MSTAEDMAARLTLKLAGVFQQVRNLWVQRIDSYFSQLESLTNGQWLDSSDIAGIIKESKLASREALDGLSNDLSAELIHASNGMLVRYESERVTLLNEISNLQLSLDRYFSGDENAARRENQTLRTALMKMPEFQLLTIIQSEHRASYGRLSELSGAKKGKVRKFVKALVKSEFCHVDKKSRPHTVIFDLAPWNPSSSPEHQTLQFQSKVSFQHVPFGHP